MSATEPEPEDQADEPGEEPAGSERAARLILTGVLLLAMWGIVAVLPETAYVVVGILGTLGWQKTRGWIQRRRGGTPGEDHVPPEATEHAETIAETLHRLAAPHVFLADLAAETAMSLEVTRAVLEAAGIRVRRAVRNGDRTGVGIHRDDLPPLPRPLSATPLESVDQGQPTNQQGLRIERSDGGLVIYDLADNHRHHQVGNTSPKS